MVCLYGMYDPAVKPDEWFYTLWWIQSDKIQTLAVLQSICIELLFEFTKGYQPRIRGQTACRPSKLRYYSSVA